MGRLSRRQLLVAGTGGLTATAGCLWWDDSEGGADGTPGVRTKTGSQPPATTPDPPEQIESAWPYPKYDHARTGYTPETAGPEGSVGKLWELETGERLSAPVVRDGLVSVVGQSGTVYRIDATTGKQRWTASTQPIGRSVAVVDGQLFVTTTAAMTAFESAGVRRWEVRPDDYRTGAVGPHGAYHLERRYGTTLAVGTDLTGDQRWQTDLTRQEREEVVAGDEYVYAVAGAAPEILRLDPDTGAAVGVRVPGVTPRGVTVRDGDLFHLDLSGNLHGPGWRENVATTGLSTPRVGPDRVYVSSVATGNRGLYAFGRDDGEQRWHRDLESLAFAVTTELVVARTADVLVAFDAADGTERWATDVPSRRRVSLAVVDDLVYVSHNDGLVAYRER